MVKKFLRTLIILLAIPILMSSDVLTDPAVGAGGVSQFSDLRWYDQVNVWYFAGHFARDNAEIIKEKSEGPPLRDHVENFVLKDSTFDVDEFRGTRATVNFWLDRHGICCGAFMDWVLDDPTMRALIFLNHDTEKSTSVRIVPGEPLIQQRRRRTNIDYSELGYRPKTMSGYVGAGGYVTLSEDFDTRPTHMDGALEYRTVGRAKDTTVTTETTTILPKIWPRAIRATTQLLEGSLIGAAWWMSSRSEKPESLLRNLQWGAPWMIAAGVSCLNVCIDSYALHKLRPMYYWEFTEIAPICRALAKSGCLVASLYLACNDNENPGSHRTSQDLLLSAMVMSGYTVLGILWHLYLAVL